MKNKLPDDFRIARRPPAGYRAEAVIAKAKLKSGENTQATRVDAPHQNNEGHQRGQHGGSQRDLEK
jgi:hypothetical protein